MTDEERRIAKLVGIILLSVLGLIILFTSFTSVASGEVGVVTRFGQVTRLANPGMNFVTPFVEDIITYNTKKVNYETAPQEKQKGSQADYLDFPVDTNTADGQPVDISYTIRFSVDPTKALEVASKIGNEEALVEKIVKTESRIWARNIPRDYTAEQLYTGKDTVLVQQRIFDQLRPTFEANGLIIDTFGIREVKFDDGYTAKIAEKQQAAVGIEVERNKAEQEKYKKEQEITKAQAEAEKQRLQQDTLAPQVIEKLKLDVQREWINKWNGSVPQFMTGEGQFLFQAPALK